MIIDTTKPDFFYSKTFKKIYYKNFSKLRKDFTKWIDEIGEKKSLEWWVSIPATRNQYISKLFNIFCLIESLKEIKKKTKIEEIIVGNQELKKIIEKNTRVRSKITLRNDHKKFSLKEFLFVSKIFLYQLFIYIICKFTHKKKLLKKEKIVLIDTFLIDQDLDNNKFYHKKLIEKSKEKNNIYFVPSFHSEINIIKIIKIIFKCSISKNFLLREHYLSFGDILDSFCIIFRRKRFIKKYKKLKNVDYSKLIAKEINQNHNLSSQILGLQNYSFFKNLFTSQIKIKKVINWFENQSLGKGWNLGSRTFYPEAISLGYQGYTFFPQYMCLSPSKSEHDSKVIPEVLLSIGKIYNKTREEFCKTIKIKNAPALNFQHVFKKKKIKFPKNNHVLIILTGFLQDDISLIQWCIESNLHKKNLKIYVKEHPILKIKTIKKYLSFFPDNYIITKKKFSDAVSSSKILICSGVTSAILELIVQKRFIIIPRIGPLDHVIFKKLNISKNFKVLEKPEDLSLFLRNLSTYAYNKNSFFIKQTKKNLEIFQ